MEIHCTVYGAAHGLFLLRTFVFLKQKKKKKKKKKKNSDTRGGGGVPEPPPPKPPKSANGLDILNFVQMEVQIFTQKSKIPKVQNVLDF